MKRILIICFSLVTLIFIFPQCKKKTTDLETNKQLKNKNLSEIKSIIAGNWKLHYSIGGFTGNTRTNYTNSSINFIIPATPSDSIKWIISNTVFNYDAANYLRVKSIFGDSTYLITTSSTGSTVELIADSKIGDTLILTENHSNSNTYYLSK